MTFFMKRPPFPHKVQTLAFIVLLLIFTTLVASIIFSGTGKAQNERALQSALVISCYVLFTLCLLSREKVENEKVAVLRRRIVFMESVVALFGVIILNVIQLLLPEEGFVSLKNWRMSFFWTGNYMIYFAVIYLIILKIGVRRFQYKNVS